MENKIVKKKKYAFNKIVFAILCLLVASLVTIQIILVSTAFFSNSKSANTTVVTTGNVKVSYVLYGNDGCPLVATGGSGSNVNYGMLTANEVGEYSNVLALMNGEASQYSLTITNNSTAHSCYARVKVEFLALNTTTHTYEVVTTNSPIAVSAVSNCFVYGGIIYNNVSTGVIATSGSVFLTFNVTPNSYISNYAGQNCSLRFTIQALQSENVSQGSGYGWKNSLDNTAISF